MLDQAQSVSRPWRRFLRFSMRGLIVLVLVIGGAMGWLVRAARIQRAAAAAISGIGGSVMYNWEWNNGRSYSGATPWVPKWLSDRVGVDYFGHITSVWLCAVSMETDAALAPVLRLTQLQRLSLTGSSISDSGLARMRDMTSLSRLDLDYTKVTDAGLAHLKSLTGISVLSLDATHVTDAGLAQLKQLTNLAELNLGGTQITDAGLEHLKALRNLSVLNVVNTKVTDAGMNKLKQARPSLRIYR
jgi:hypothetical protein